MHWLLGRRLHLCWSGLNDCFVTTHLRWCHSICVTAFINKSIGNAAVAAKHVTKEKGPGMATYTYRDRMALKFMVRAQKLMLSAMLSDGDLKPETQEDVKALLEQERLLRIETELDRMGPGE